MEKIYWTMKNGQKINVDTMDIQHLRNTLKMLIRAKRAQSTPKEPRHWSGLNGDIAQDMLDQALLAEQQENLDEWYGQ
jgi:hypothetical protein